MMQFTHRWYMHRVTQPNRLLSSTTLIHVYRNPMLHGLGELLLLRGCCSGQRDNPAQQELPLCFTTTGKASSAVIKSQSLLVTALLTSSHKETLPPPSQTFSLAGSTVRMCRNWQFCDPKRKGFVIADLHPPNHILTARPAQHLQHHQHS